jgi:glycosyltransferase involved in cell wall biosynthesis
MEQIIAPKRIEVELLAEERDKFSDWEINTAEDPFWERYAEREELEWCEADLILCGSEFVRDGVARCGGAEKKCRVVPYGVDIPQREAKSGKRKAANEVDKPHHAGTFHRGMMERKGPLRVLTIGAVGLRKGSPYVLQAAKQLKRKAAFRLVGNIAVSPQARDELRKHVELIGPVPRSEISQHFTWADVFLLPSLCEGSATVTYEALAHGLPVVCSANTGSVVRHGEEGFLVPIRDVEAIVERLERIVGDWELRIRMSDSARARAEEFTIELYGQRLLAALREEIPA